jgi:hypothetical protein
VLQLLKLPDSTVKVLVEGAGAPASAPMCARRPVLEAEVEVPPMITATR